MAKLSFQIRNLQESDAEAVAHLNTACWKINYRGFIPDIFLDNISITPKRIAHFQSIICNAQISLGVFRQGALLGYLCGDHPQNKTLPYLFELQYLYVHPDFQGLGIGSSLFHAFQEKLEPQNFCLFILDGNQKALSFYQKMGCIPQSQYDADKVIMGLTIHEHCLSFSE